MDKLDRALLLSVRPRFADSILAGTKTAEIRRQRPAVRPRALVIIYATKPLGAIVGTARILNLSEGSPDDMWREHQASVGVTKEELDNYLTGTETAYILKLDNIQRLEPLLTLEQIRAATSFQPPQSYRYVTSTILESFVTDHPDSGSLLTMLRS